MTRINTDAPQTAPPLISVSVAAAMLNVQRSQVYKLIRAGRLEAVNVGVGRRHAFRVRLESVNAILGTY